MDTLDNLRAASMINYSERRRLQRASRSLHVVDVYLDLGRRMLGEDRMLEVWYDCDDGDPDFNAPPYFEVLAVWDNFDGVMVDILSAIHDTNELEKQVKACISG